MNIDIKDTINLSDNNEYVVVSKVNYENNIYYYLIDIENTANVKFCMENKENSVLEVVDQALIQTLLPMFLNEAKDHINIDMFN